MRSINIQILESYLLSHPIQPSFNKHISSYSFPDLRMREMDTKAVLSQCHKLNNKLIKYDEQRLRKQREETIWWKGELKVFVWFTLFYCHNNSISPSELNNQDFQFIGRVFLSQPLIRLKHELKSIFESRSDQRKIWAEEEVTLFKKIVGTRAEKKEKRLWKSISFELFEHSDGNFFKTFRQCRQMWMNHVDPKVNRSPWTASQNIQLAQLVVKIGPFWSDISKEFGGTRTQHMTKNRYRFILKKLGLEKQSDSKVTRKSVLNKVRQEYSRSAVKTGLNQKLKEEVKILEPEYEIKNYSSGEQNYKSTNQEKSENLLKMDQLDSFFALDFQKEEVKVEKNPIYQDYRYQIPEEVDLFVSLINREEFSYQKMTL